MIRAHARSRHRLAGLSGSGTATDASRTPLADRLHRSIASHLEYPRAVRPLRALHMITVGLVFGL